MRELEEFLEWSAKVKPEVSQVSVILSEKLSDEPANLIKDLQEIEAWNARMGSLLAQADSWLDRYKFLVMPPKGDSKSEADRKLFTDNEVSPIRLMRDTLENICDAIRQRLILGESILSFHKQQYAERKAPITLDRVY